MNMYELYDYPIWCMAACYQDDDKGKHFRKVPYVWNGSNWQRGGYNMRSNLHNATELIAHIDKLKHAVLLMECPEATNGSVDIRPAMVLIGGLVCIDIDHVGDDPKSNPIVQDVVERCNSYTELSYSGHGVHVYGHGHLPNGITSIRLHPPEYPDMEIEIYTCSSDMDTDTDTDKINNARCMVHTDNAISSSIELNDLTDICSSLCTQYQYQYEHGSAAHEQGDRAGIHRRMRYDYDYDNDEALTWESKFKIMRDKVDIHPQDELHERLCKQLQRSQAPGTLAYYWYNHVREEEPFDESRADLRMLIQLAYVCSGNAADMLMLFKESPYYNAKDTMHLKKWGRPSYADTTLSKAVDAYAYNEANKPNKSNKSNK